MSTLLQLYRERNGDPGFWAEPASAISNGSFLVAAVAAWLLARQHRALTTGTWTLIVLSSLIAVGSFVFHTVPTAVTRWMDIIPIALFQAAFLWLSCRHTFQISSMASAAIIVVVIGSSYPLMRLSTLNGSLGYFPTLVSLAVFSAAYLHQRGVEPATLLAAVVVFATAVIARMVDWVVPFPLGTHFLWHLLNGVVVYLLMRVWILHLTRSERTLL